MYNLLIVNGEIFDGTGASPYHGHIGIKGDRILKIGTDTPCTANRIIDAEGMCVCPGFVDIHGHSDYFLLINPKAESKVRQGVTTEIGGNCGYAAAPIFGQEANERKAEYKKQFSLDLNWHTIKEYRDLLENIGIAINFIPLIGHNTIRASVMGKENREPDQKELEGMCFAIENGMREGAFGMSTGLIYPPACFSNTKELIVLNNIVKRFKGIFTTHIRNEDDSAIEAIREVVHIAKEVSIPLQISHLKTSRERNWNKLDEIFEIIEEARLEGVKIDCDRYPYIASHTGLKAILPNWATEGNNEIIINKLKDKTIREKIRDDILKKHPDLTYWNTIVISTLTSEKNKGYEGMRISDAAKKAGKDPFNFTFDILIEEKTNISANYFTMCEENMIRILKKPYTMIGSDAACRADYGPLSQGKPHPRAFGTFPRVLGRYVNKKGMLDISTAIKKMTSDPCRKLGIKARGEIREGFFADLVLFDSEKIIDRATFSDPIQYPEGIEYVIVNGKVTIEKGEHSGCANGRVLRKGE
ncbi:MAG: D-aminoacylase [Thermodesulfobacteriota bacterium]|nr:D-aminoacylase [Thermodesulfobacteriota bacterium]